MLKRIGGWVPDVMGLRKPPTPAVQSWRLGFHAKNIGQLHDSYIGFPIKLGGNVRVPISNLFENYQNRITLGWSSENQNLLQCFIIAWVFRSSKKESVETCDNTHGLLKLFCPRLSLLLLPILSDFPFLRYFFVLRPVTSANSVYEELLRIRG